MKIYPESDPDDFVDVELCEEDNSLCSISIYVTPIGMACSYLNLQEIEQLQKELTKIAAKMRAFHAKS